MKLVVTGLTGYVGQVLAERFAVDARGFCGGVALTRSPPAPVGGPPWQWVPFLLGAPITELDWSEVGAVIHLAAATAEQPDAAAEQRTVDYLLEGCARSGARFVLASSVVAAAPDGSPYARTKYQIEQRVAATGIGSAVVRLGWVYGGRRAGLFGTLARVAGVLPTVVTVRPSPPLQPVHAHDVADALLKLAAGGSAVPPAEDGIWRLVSPAPVPVDRVVADLAWHLHRRRLSRWSIPGEPATSAAIGALRLASRLRVSDFRLLDSYWATRLASLIHNPVEPDRGEWSLLGLTPRLWPDGVTDAASGEAPKGGPPRVPSEVPPEVPHEVPATYSKAFGAPPSARLLSLYLDWFHRSRASGGPTSAAARSERVVARLASFSADTDALYRTAPNGKLRTAGRVAGALAAEVLTRRGPR